MANQDPPLAAKIIAVVIIAIIFLGVVLPLLLLLGTTLWDAVLD